MMSNGLHETALPLKLVINASNAGANEEPQTCVLPRSASYTQLPADDQSPYIPQRRDSLRRSLSENVLTNPDPGQQHRFSQDAVAVLPNSRGSLRRRVSAKRKPKILESDSKVTISQFALGADDATENTEQEIPVEKEKQEAKLDRQRIKRSISGSITNIARRSWVSASRSPSPSPQKKVSMPASEVVPNASSQISKPSIGSVDKEPHGLSKVTNGSQVNGLRRQNSFLGRKSRRPLSALLGKDQGIPNPTVPPIPKSFSTEKLPSLNHKSSMVGTPAVPRTPSFERLQQSGTETPRKKDDLWGAFRSLDGEYQK